jgi:hypothetical protein
MHEAKKKAYRIKESVSKLLKCLNMKEISFFENNSVIVTQTRFIVGHKVTEIKNISSVKVEVLRSYRKIQVIVMLIGFLLMFFKELRIAGFVVFGATFLFMCLMEEKFTVRVNTNSGETDTLVSKDKEYIEQVAKAINSAMWTYYSQAAPM